MTDGMHIDVVSLDLDTSGHGRLRLRLATLAAFKAAVAFLDPGAVLVDNLSRSHHLRLSGDTPQPSQFPCEAVLAVIETDLPEDAVRFRMDFGNNFLKSGCSVEVIRFDPPSQDGTEGVLRVQCRTPEDYEQLRRFVDEEHGSALKSMEGGVWYVHRLADDGDRARPFPQNVSVRLEWLYRS